MAKAAKDAVPRSKAPTKSPRPRDLGMGGQSDPIPAVLTPFGQRQVMWYRGKDHNVMGVVWPEFIHEKVEPMPGLPKGGTVRKIKCYHVLHTGDNGGVVHEEVKPIESRHFSPTSATTTLQQFEDYLRERLHKFGGLKDCWLLLGLQPPAQSAEPAPESKAGHEDMYKRAATLLGTTVEELKKKYGHLNPGLQQMNLRNRLRAKGHNV